MKNSVSVTIPSHLEYYPIVQYTLCQLMQAFVDEEIRRVDIALKELVLNSIQHAYKDHEGLITVDYHRFLHGIQVDVRDQGIPMSMDIVTDEETQGFSKIERLVDRFTYQNLGMQGKKFSLIKYSSASIVQEKHSLAQETKERKPIQDEPLTVRPFSEGDERGIARLIYENYGLSYIKDLFYYPRKILEHHGTKFHSIVVANAQEKIVGHFAFILAQESNIAEVGIAVVSPEYQGRGLMNRMFDQILSQAESLQLEALYGEAIMYHAYSQKSNLKHGFTETALEIGKFINTVKLKDNPFSEMDKRGSVLVGYKLLQPIDKALFVPIIYGEKVTEIYERCPEMSYRISEEAIISRYSSVRYTFDSYYGVATIIIDRYNEEDFYHSFHNILDHLRAKHIDMIYADINMEQIPQIDEVVETLNRSLFFFSGVFFLRHGEQDYLHLQYKHSEALGYENMVTYSDFSQSLLAYIIEDEKRVRTLKV